MWYRWGEFEVHYTHLCKSHNEISLYNADEETSV
jgi:hypothetical protein